MGSRGTTLASRAGCGVEPQSLEDFWQCWHIMLPRSNTNSGKIFNLKRLSLKNIVGTNSQCIERGENRPLVNPKLWVGSGVTFDTFDYVRDLTKFPTFNRARPTGRASREERYSCKILAVSRDFINMYSFSNSSNSIFFAFPNIATSSVIRS